MSTVRVDRAAAAGPLGHDEPRFHARFGAQRSQVSLGDGWPGFARRGALPARVSCLFSPALLMLYAAERRREAQKRLRSRATRTRGCSGHELGHACCFARAVAPVNPTLVLLISHAHLSHAAAEDASSSRGDSSSEASNNEGAVLASACKTLAKQSSASEALLCVA